MKRCPQCDRVETDDTLAFCRADGTALVSESSSIDQEAGTVKLGSGSVANETAAGVLPQTTDANINRATAPTTVLPVRPGFRVCAGSKLSRRWILYDPIRVIRSY